MPRFTFHLEADAQSTPEFVIDHLPDSLAALDFARRLLDQRPRYGRVEVIQGEMLVGALSRTAAMAPPDEAGGAEARS